MPVLRCLTIRPGSVKPTDRIPMQDRHKTPTHPHHPPASTMNGLESGLVVIVEAGDAARPGGDPCGRLPAYLPGHLRCGRLPAYLPGLRFEGVRKTAAPPCPTHPTLLYCP